MCSQKELQKITHRMAGAYQQVYGDAIDQMILYGSYARGNYNEFSDIDLAAIVHGDRITLQKQLRQVWDVSTDLGLECDVIVSPTVIPYDEFEKYKTILPYYQNIDREGVRINA